jgi:hydroxymethylglutaryl-CoA synthase
VAGIVRYGAYLPRYRASVKDIHAFFGRPGRPRARTLATPGLDEDALTMAFEAAEEALAGARAPGAMISVTNSAPFGMRKMSATLGRALRLSPDTSTYDVGGHPGSLVDALELGGLLAAANGAPSIVVASDHVVSYDERVADTLSAGGASAFLVAGGEGFARLGPLARHSSEVYDVWVLGKEPEPRYRLEVLNDAYLSAATGAMAKLERLTERPVGGYQAVAASQPHPQVLRALGRVGVTGKQLEHTSFVGEIGNLGSASVGVALSLAFDTARKGQQILLFGYGAGEGIAQSVEISSATPKIGVAERIPGDEIGIGTYYRWTRGRQVEPH